MTLPESISREELAALLAYYKECGVTALSGDEPAGIELFPESAPVASHSQHYGTQGHSAQPAGFNRPAPAPWKTATPSASQPNNRPGVGTGTAPGEFRQGKPGGNVQGGAPPSRPVFTPTSSASTKPTPKATPTPRPIKPLPNFAAGGGEESLVELDREVAICHRCSLSSTRTQTVFGVGSPKARVVFVGEGPGAEEDRQGEPFVGAAGKLLDRMFRAVEMARSEVYIANVVKCRPPGNRNPLEEEIAQCQGFLFLQLEAIAPQVIVALGKFAIQSFLGKVGNIKQVRGRVHYWRKVPLIVTYHPAYYLRTPGRKRAGWEDLQLLMRTLEELEK
ncbi:MAG: uracil-DNA glycosylase [Magnetococcales bacterium]|nr:uracil-DNA glycosylase [Magnetococcales bacterium]